MKRRTFLAIGFSFSTVSVRPLFARDHDSDRQHKHGGNHDEDGHSGDKHDRGKDREEHYFRQEDAVYLRRYYSGPTNLPLGLRKKYYRRGTLPPGWAKRLRPLPPAVLRQLPPPAPNCERGYLDGYAVAYDRHTHIIVDVMDVLSVEATLGR